MSVMVLDASVTMTWCFADEASAATDVVLDSVRTAGAVVPSLWVEEVANILLFAEQRGRISEVDSRRFIEDLSALPITVMAASGIHSLLDIGRVHGLTAYEAAYLELAWRLGGRLATLDKALRDASVASGTELILS